MIKDLMINSSFIITCLFIAGQIFKHVSLPIKTYPLKTLAGLLGGIFGSILMMFSVHVTETIIVDMRSVALVITTFYGGGTASLVAVMMMSLTRTLIFGINKASLIAVCVLCVSSVLFVTINTIKRLTGKQRYWLMILGGLCISFLAFSVLITDKKLLAKLFLDYTLITIGSSFFSYIVSTYIQESNKVLRKLHEESRKDFLTGLNNVRQFDELFNLHVRQAEEQKENLSILLIDIDFFKKVNDTYGHPAGDQVLQKLGEVLKGATRHFDIVCRNGGEEFSVLLLDCSHQRAIEIAERIRIAVEETVFRISDQQEIWITISTGVASYPETTENNRQLLVQADNALYTAKHLGRNRVCSALLT